MKRMYMPIVALLCLVALPACSFFGEVDVDVAPYNVLQAEGDFELRHYESLLLATTEMPEGMDGTSTPFFKLFDYISGNNQKDETIEMTAPVFLDQASSVTKSMSFVLPLNFKMATAPSPLDPAVTLQEIRDYTVATVKFTGFLSQNAIGVEEKRLRDWIADKGLEITGAAKAAGYNPPYTIPFLRRNEIVIPVVRP